MGGKKRAKGITMVDVIHNQRSAPFSKASMSQPIQHHVIRPQSQSKMHTPQVGLMLTPQVLTILLIRKNNQKKNQTCSY